MKLLFPDACWRPDLVSGSVFLYFHEEHPAFTLHPSVSTFLTGIDPFEFFKFAEDRKPNWFPKLQSFIRIWRKYRGSLDHTSEILAPLHGDAFKTIMLSYPRGSNAWNEAEDLIASSNLPFDEITKLIDPYSASDELFSHIFFEKYLELYEGHRSNDEMVALGKEMAESKAAPPKKSVDWKALYEYCDKRFGNEELEATLTASYMFRLPMLRQMPSVLLSNPGMISFLSSLPIVPQKESGEGKPLDMDAIAWEFFRQLLSSKIDPLEKDSVERIRSLVQRHTAEIVALKRKCLALAEELGDEHDLEVLQKRISQHIRANVEKEIEDLLFLNEATVNEFLDSVFADDKAWIAIATMLYSTVQGGPLLTAGAAIATLSRIGSKAMKAVAERRNKLETSDYALLYRMSP